ncbi:hypothetical protein G6F56_008949 [Rhizopus delemar]|nr:hypothetical protein G6F56_008949 [Rhizopus delemar]
MPASTIRMTRSKRAARDSITSTSSLSSERSVSPDKSKSHSPAPVAHGLNHFSNRPGSPSYAEVTNGARPRPHSPSLTAAVNHADSVERMFDSVELKKERDLSECSDAMSQSSMNEDSSSEISDHAMSDRRKAKSKKSSRPSKKFSSNKRDGDNEIFLLKRQYKKENNYLQNLIQRCKAEDDETKAKILKRKIADSCEDLDNIQDQIRKFRAHKNEHEFKEGKSKHVVRPMKVKIPDGALPIFRLEAASSYRFKQYGEDKSGSSNGSSTFRTVRDFIRIFENVVGKYFNDMNKVWFRYLKKSIDSSQDDRAINWFHYYGKQDNFKNGSWEYGQAALISNFEDSFTQDQYCEKLCRIRQCVGEFPHLYIDRYMDLMQKADLEDSRWAVIGFLESLQDKVKERVIDRLKIERASDPMHITDCYMLKADSLQNIQALLDKNKTYLIGECNKIFQDVKHVDLKTPNLPEKSKRKHIAEDHQGRDYKRHRDDRHQDRPHYRQDRPSYRPRYNGRRQGRSDRATPCRLCGDPAIIRHLNVCPVLAKRTAIYNNKGNGAGASRHAPKNYTGNFLQRHRSFEDKLHQETLLIDESIRLKQHLQKLP